MDEKSEPFRMPDGSTWNFEFDKATGLHSLTHTKPDGEVRARMTMNRDELTELISKLGELQAQAAEITPEKIIEGGQPDRDD